MTTRVPKGAFNLLEKAGYGGNQLVLLQKILKLSSRTFDRAKIRQDELARLCFITTKTVSNILPQLRADGVLSYPDGRGKFKEYSLNFVKLIEMARSNGHESDDWDEFVKAARESDDWDVKARTIIKPSCPADEEIRKDFVSDTKKVLNKYEKSSEQIRKDFVSDTKKVRISEPDNSSQPTDNVSLSSDAVSPTKGLLRVYEGSTKGSTSDFAEERKIVVASSEFSKPNPKPEPLEIPSEFEPGSFEQQAYAAIAGRKDQLPNFLSKQEFRSLSVTPSQPVSDESEYDELLELLS
jgi:hypothetical protein